MEAPVNSEGAPETEDIACRCRRCRCCDPPCAPPRWRVGAPERRRSRSKSRGDDGGSAGAATTADDIRAAAARAAVSGAFLSTQPTAGRSWRGWEDSDGGAQSPQAALPQWLCRALATQDAAWLRERRLAVGSTWVAGRPRVRRDAASHQSMAAACERAGASGGRCVGPRLVRIGRGQNSGFSKDEFYSCPRLLGMCMG